MKLNAIGPNQTEIIKPDGTTVFFSYNTPVAVFVPGQGALCTTERHSVTTSRHVNQTVARWGATRTNVAPEVIAKYANA